VKHAFVGLPGRALDACEGVVPQTQIRDECAKQLEAQFQILGGGAPAEDESVVAHAELNAGGFSREHAAQLVDVVFSKAPLVDETVCDRDEFNLVERHLQHASAKPRRQRDAVCLEIGLLEIQPDAIGKLHEHNIEILDVFARNNVARRPEIRVAEFGSGDFLRWFDWFGKTGREN